MLLDTQIGDLGIALATRNLGAGDGGGWSTPKPGSFTRKKASQ